MRFLLVCLFVTVGVATAELCRVCAISLLLYVRCAVNALVVFERCLPVKIDRFSSSRERHVNVLCFFMIVQFNARTVGDALGLCLGLVYFALPSRVPSGSKLMQFACHRGPHRYDTSSHSAWC